MPESNPHLDAPSAESPRIWTPVVIGLLALMSLAIGLMRAHFYDWPIEVDIPLYAVIGRGLTEGRELYTDLWDHKPPLLYLTFALNHMVFGDGPFGIYFLNTVCGVATLLGIYVAGTRLGASAKANRAAGLMAALFWTVVSGDIWLQLHEPNCEAFINALVVWAFVLLLPNEQVALEQDEPATSSPFSSRRALGIGVLLALASLYKHIGAVIALPLAIAHVLAPPAGTTRKQAFGHVALFALPGLIAWLLVFGYFAAVGRFGDAWDTLIVYNRWHAGGLSENIIKAFSIYFLLQTLTKYVVCVPMFALCIPGVLLGLDRGKLRPWAMLVGLFLGCHLALALPGQFFMHYAQYWLPPLAIGSAWTIVLLVSLARRAPKWLAAAPGVIILAILLVHESNVFTNDAEFFYGETVNAATQRLGKEIGEALNDDESVFQWGNEPGIYHFSGKRPPSLIWCEPAITGPFPERFTQRVLDDLNATPPDMVVVPRKFLAKAPQHAMNQWVQRNYVNVNDEMSERYPRFVLGLRRGSALAERMGNKRDSSPTPNPTSSPTPDPTPN